MLWATFLSQKVYVGPISATTFTQCATEAIEFGEKKQNKGRYAVQGYSRSPILVPIESSYTTSYYSD